MTHSRLAYLLLALTALFWGGNSVAGKMAVGEISPMLLTAARWGIACVALITIGWRELHADRAVIARHWIWLAAMAFFGFSLFNAALYSALTITSAVNSAVVQAGMPAVVFLLSFVLHGQKTRPLQIAGFALTLVGVAVVAARGELSRLFTLEINAGDALVLAAIAVYGVYTVQLRDKPPLHWKSLMVMLTGFAFLTSLPFVAFEAWADQLVLPGATGLGVVAYTAIFPSILAQAFWIRGNELIGANRAGLFINLVPVFGTLLAVIVLGERLETFHVLALVLVFAGIGLAEMGKRGG
mgnify:CR=1 FL=1